MELGIGMFGDLTFDRTTKKFQPTSERLQQIIEEVKLADELGVDVFLMGEHHRPDYSVPSPEIMLSALSSVTKRIKLGSGVTVLSSSDPVKVYQDFSMIDLMSNQRAEIVAGRGSFIESFPLFGYDLKDYNTLFEEKLDLLLEINKNKSVTWSGKHRAPLNNQVVYPRAERELPIWIAVGGTPASVERAARLGVPLIVAIIGGQPRQFKPLIDYYKELYVAHGHDPEKMQVGVHSHTFITESREELVDGYYPYYADQMDRVGQSRGWPPYRKEQFLAGISRDGALYMGEPDYVADKIIETIEMFGLTRYVAHIDIGGPKHSELMKCIELYGSKVIPQVRKAVEG